MTMTFNIPLIWMFLLSMFTSFVIKESVTITGPDIDWRTALFKGDYMPRHVQGPAGLVNGSKPTQDMSVEDTTSSPYDVTRLGPTSTHAAQTSSLIVGRETVASAQSRMAESSGTYPKIHETTTIARNGTTTLVTPTASGDSRKNTRSFSNKFGRPVKAPVDDLSTDWRDEGPVRVIGNDSGDLGEELNIKDIVTVENPVSLVTTVLPSLDVYWQERMSKKLLVYISPFLIVIGTVGNSVSFITLQSRLFRFSSTGMILTALSMVDIAVLNTGLMRLWLSNAFGLNIRNLSRFGCKIHILLTYYLHQLASWTLILLTIERTIALWFPLRCKELCNRKRIISAWFIIATLLFAEHAFFFKVFDMQPTTIAPEDNNTTRVTYSCAIHEDWYRFFDLDWSYIDATVGDFFPFTVVLVGNTLTIIRILKSRWERERQMGATVPSANANAKLMASTTAMLIGVSVMFLVLSLPIDILFLYYAYHGSVLPQNEEQAIYNLAYAVVTLSYYTNNALDFLMYFVSGRKFRQAFIETFLPCRKTAKPNARTLTHNRCRSQDTNPPNAVQIMDQAIDNSAC